MISKIAEFITQYLIVSAVVEEKDRDLYIYGFFLLLARLYFFFVTMITGFIVGILIESIVFYIVFEFLRNYAGGIHAKTENICIFLSTIVFATSVVAIRMLSIMNADACFLVFILCCLFICVFCPLDSNSKPLDSFEKNRYRAVCHLIVLLCVGSAVIAKSLLLNTFFYSIFVAVFLEAILLFVGIRFR